VFKNVPHNQNQYLIVFNKSRESLSELETTIAEKRGKATKKGGATPFDPLRAGGSAFFINVEEASLPLHSGKMPLPPYRFQCLEGLLLQLEDEGAERREVEL
jgi:hypothetical protein